MREIKFRAIAKDTKTMVFGKSLIQGEIEGRKFVQIEQTIESDFHQWDVIPETIGQFTGMTDKNGVEIYEGDKIIFGNPRITQVVVFRNGQFMAKQLKGSYIGLGYCNWETCSEVVGNIYETQTV